MSKFKKDGGKTRHLELTLHLYRILYLCCYFSLWLLQLVKRTDPTVKVVKPTGVEAADMTPYKQRSEIDFLYLG